MHYLVDCSEWDDMLPIEGKLSDVQEFLDETVVSRYPNCCVSILDYNHHLISYRLPKHQWVLTSQYQEKSLVVA